MEAIRKQLMAGDGKLDKKAYKFAVEAELKRLFRQLIFLTFMSFLVACVLFISLYFDIKNADKYAEEANGVPATTPTTPTAPKGAK